MLRCVFELVGLGQVRLQDELADFRKVLHHADLLPNDIKLTLKVYRLEVLSEVFVFH